MAVKDDLLNWVITNKNEIAAIDPESGEEFYPTFRAGEAAADLDTNLGNVNNALGALKKEGLVVNPERGLWAWTGAVPAPAEKAEKAPRKRAASAPKDPLASAAETIQRSLESATYQYNKAQEEAVKVKARLDELVETMNRLAGEEIALRLALDTLNQ